MKLVDILAMEMKDWPENALAKCAALFIAQDSDGMIVTLDPEEKPRATQFRGFDWSRAYWTGIDLTLDVSDDHATAIVTREQWQAAVDALKVPAWNGEGLPPVGTVCELRANQGGWGKAEIKYQGRNVCVWLWVGEGVSADQVEWAESPQRIEFRPIRTAEQIAADEREQVCKQICIDAGSPEQTHYQMLTAYRLYDAGYRKQVTP